jgi:integrase
MKILSKKEIRRIRRMEGPGFEAMADMAEHYRRYYRQKRRDERRKVKRYCKSTDILTTDQLGKLFDYLTAYDDTRTRTNRMIIVLLAESGIRALEAINLKNKHMPFYHEHNAIDVEDGKGGEDRSVGISDYLIEAVKKYIGAGWTPTGSFLRDERGKTFSYQAFYARVKRIGRAVGIPWLSPHKFRHTFATLLYDETNNDFLVQTQLGHKRADTTKIYVRTVTEIFRSEMGKFHNRLWSGQKQGFLPYNRKNS